LKIRRILGAGPLHSTEHTCRQFSTYIRGVLEQRRHPDADDIAGRLEKTFPVIRFLLSKRSFADPAVVFSTGDMTVEFGISYDVARRENLAPARTTLLADLSRQSEIRVTLYAVEPVVQDFHRLLQRFSDDRVRLELLDSHDDHVDELCGKKHDTPVEGTDAPDDVSDRPDHSKESRTNLAKDEEPADERNAERGDVRG
jgi:hypothetical protein